MLFSIESFNNSKMNPYVKNNIRPNETMNADFFLFFNIKFIISNKIIIAIIIIDIGENKS